MNSRFSLRTFGAPALLDGRGRPLPLRKKDLALLIYLRIENKPCSRSALAGLLWGEATEAKARHSLTQTIGRLREQLGSDSIVPSNGDVALQSELECDAARLLAGAEFHPDGYHGDFLAAFAPGTGSESFMEWADGKRTVCRLRLTKLLDSLGAAAEADEHYGEALQLGLQLTQVEPLFEEGHRRVMRSWRALGERAMALRHYDRMCEWLKSDISADPDSASQALARSIRSEQRQFDGVCAPAPPRSSGYGRPLDSRASRRALALIGGMATIALFASGWAFLDYQANVRRDEPAIVFETRSSGRRLFFRVRAGRAPEVFKLRYPARFTRYWSDAAQLLATEVRDSAGNRDVVLIDTDGDSTYVTRHPATDEFSWWAPDGKRFLFSSFRNGTADLFLSSLDGRKITPMSPGAAEDDRGCWSPRGDLIGFRTTRGGMREQWVMDADGKRPRRVLPAADPGACSFSPDGEHMAFTAMGDRRSLYVWHARTDKVEKLLDNAYGASWSPDGLWLAVQAAGESGTDIYRVRGDGYVVENMSRDSAEDRLMGWDGEHRPHYIDEVRINATKPLQLAVAERRKLKARAADPHGNYFGYDAFRWESLDPAVASLLPDGTVVGVKPGRARIVASAGGWRADTISAEVFESAPQVLLEEHFEAGLTRNWIIFGDPRPRVVAGGGVGGTAGFVSSGDDFFESGLISKQQFQLDAGLTVELSARGPERWRLHDLLAIDLISFSADTSGIGAGRLLDLARRTVATLWWIGGYGDRPQLRFGGTRPIDPTGGLPEWHRIALQVRPDGYQELYIDEHLVATSAPSERGIEEVGAAQLVIGYRSRSDLPAQDELIVYRGLKYSSSRQ